MKSEVINYIISSSLIPIGIEIFFMLVVLWLVIKIFVLSNTSKDLIKAELDKMPSYSLKTNFSKGRVLLADARIRFKHIDTVLEKISDRITLFFLMLGVVFFIYILFIPSRVDNLIKAVTAPNVVYKEYLKGE